MDRVNSVLLLLLVLAVTGVGTIVWRADQRARDDAAELACVQRIEATATIALLTPEERVDDAGRLSAIEVLGRQLEAC